MGKLLCRIGWHRWRLVGYANVFLSDYINECSRCGVGRCEFQFGSAHMMYTAEQMRELKERTLIPAATTLPPAAPIGHEQGETEAARNTKNESL